MRFFYIEIVPNFLPQIMSIWLLSQNRHNLDKKSICRSLMRHFQILPWEQCFGSVSLKCISGSSQKFLWIRMQAAPREILLVTLQNFPIAIFNFWPHSINKEPLVAPRRATGWASDDPELNSWQREDGPALSRSLHGQDPPMCQGWGFRAENRNIW